MKRTKGAIIFAILAMSPVFLFAQETASTVDAPSRESTVGTSTSPSHESLFSAVFPSASGTVQHLLIDSKDLTKPEEEAEREATLKLLESRPIERPGIFTFSAWWIQHSIHMGISVNTIVLILLLPVLAMLVAFIRVIIGLPSLEMLVPITLTYVLVAVGIATGGVILVTVLLASFISRFLLRRLSIMHYPKRSLSMLLLAIMVFAALSIGIELGLESIKGISIFPIIILTLLGDSIVSVQLHKSVREALLIIGVTVGLGVFGYLIASSLMVRNTLILYPEILFLIIPLNIAMGRYFGLRLSEMIRFREFDVYRIVK